MLFYKKVVIRFPVGRMAMRIRALDSETLQEKKSGNARTPIRADESSEWGELVTVISSFINR